MEPHVAKSPSDDAHLVAAWMARVEGEPGAILAAASRDGGETWGPPQALAFNTCAGGPEGLPSASDPWVAIGPEGRVYVSAIAWKPGESYDSASVLTVATSDDGGQTWGEGVAVSASWAGEFMHDNTAVVADPSAPGVAWVATTRWSPAGRPAATSGTRDGGRTWSLLTNVSPSYQQAPASAPQPVIWRDALYVFYGHDADGSRISFVRSDDGGERWSDPTMVHAGTPIEGAVRFPGTEDEIAVAEDIMHAAVDPGGSTLYVTFTTASAEAPEEPRVMVTASGDGGSTWSESLLVDPGAHATWRPTLAVAPGGPAIVTWFGAGEAGFATEVRLLAIHFSGNRALEPGRRELLDRFEWRPRYTGARFLGDYHGLVTTTGGAIAVYARSTPQGQRIVTLRQPLP